MSKNLSLNNRKTRNRKGFTLIELIVVIAIIAIIAAVAVPKITVMMEEAKETTFYTDMYNLRIAGITAVEDDPELRGYANKNKGDTNRTAVAKTVADYYGAPIIYQDDNPAYPFVAGIEPPFGESWRFTFDSHGIYLKAGKVKKAEGEAFAQKMNYGNLEWPTGSSLEPDERNINIYWTERMGLVASLYILIAPF